MPRGTTAPPARIAKAPPRIAPRIMPRIMVAVAIEDAGWRREIADPAPALRKAARRALAAARGDGWRRRGAAFGLSVALIGDRAMRDLNFTYRGKNRPTNVLSFGSDPSGGESGGDSGGDPGGAPPPKSRRKRDARVELGDVAIALGVVRREAKAQGKTVQAHLAHLMVHAVLHLLGYDHERETEAERMENVERKALAAMGVADPYQ